MFKPGIVAGLNAANVDPVTDGILLDLEIGDQSGQISELGNPGLGDLSSGDGRHRGRNILKALFALLGCDDNLLQPDFALRCIIRRRGLFCCCLRPNGGANRKG